MKTNQNVKYLILKLICVIIFLSSCSKEYYIGGYFDNKINEKPIANLEVGLYKLNKPFSLDLKWRDFTLLQSVKTDNSGQFIFEISEKDDLTNCYYLPVQTNDTLSINSKYVIDWENIETIDWSDDHTFTLNPSTLTHIHINDFDNKNTIRIESDNIISYGNYDGNKTYYTFPIISGEFHNFKIFDTESGNDKLLKILDLYVKSRIDETDNLFDIMPTEFIIDINIE